MSNTIEPLKELAVFKDILEKDVWGPVFWSLFHKQAKRGFSKLWLDQFEKSIICPDCREHFIELRKRFPIYKFDSEVWAWLIHNMVNTERSNKPFYSWDEYERNYK